MARQKRSAPLDKSLQAAQDRLKQFIEASHDGFFALDRDWRIIFANRRFGDMVMRDLPELIGKNFQEEFPQLTGTPVEQNYRLAMDEGKPVQFEAAGSDANSWYEISVHPTPEGIAVFCSDRTNEKRALEDLRESEERYRKLSLDLEQRNAQLDTERQRWQGIVKGIADEVWVCDLEGKMSLINLDSITAMGLKDFVEKTPDLVSKDVEILELNGEPRPFDRWPLIRSLKGEILRGEEMMRDRKTGKSRIRRYSTGPIHDEQGSIIGSVAIVRDITDVKRADIELQKAHQETINILESIGDAFYHLDKEWCFTYVNEKSEKMWGKRREDLEGKKIWEVFPQLVGTESYNAHLQAMQSQHPIYLETISAILKTWITLSFYPTEDGLSVYFRDITEQKAAEEALRRSESVLAQAGEMAHLGAWDIEVIRPEDINNNPLHWSDEVFRIFGYEPGSVEVTNDLFFSHVPPEDQPLVGNTVQKALKEHSNYEVEHRLIRKGGEERIVVERAQITYDKKGRPRWIVGAVQDITEQKKAQLALKEYSEKLERSNKELQEFAYVASHDLQEPLRKVSAFGSSLFEHLQPTLGEHDLDQFNRLLNATRRMQEMIRDLLELSRVNTQGRPFQFVNLNKIVKNVVADLEMSAENTGGKIILGNLPPVFADPVQMERLLMNLIGNGLKYHRKDVPPTVQVSGREIQDKNQDLVEVCVKDNGIGFDMQYADLIFQPFHRLNGRSQFEGTGMGLAICKRIIDRHHGSIFAKSKSGEGSIFTFILPKR